MAKQISHTLGGLPLALDQAGAYIQETGCGLSDYLEQYKVRRAELLKYRGEYSSDYPESVATTWSLSFERIERANAGAADLLRVCAFLHSDAIPEEFFTRGARYLGPSFHLLAENTTTIDQIIGEILKYSLIHRNPRDKTLAIHRLVQAVLVDKMDEGTQYIWAKRIVKAVNQVFLLDEAIRSQSAQRYLLHALACTQLVKKWDITSSEASHEGAQDAAQLYCSTGKYLWSSGYYTQAEECCLEAQDMLNRIPEENTALTCACLIIQMATKAESGDLLKAEALGEQLQPLCEKELGPEHPCTVFSIFYLANLYMKRGKFDQAEPLITRALTICKSAEVPQIYPLSETLMSLAKLYSKRGNSTKAETLYREALVMSEQAYGLEDPMVADVLTELAIHYSIHEELEKAEQLRKRALEIYTKSVDPYHPDIAMTLSGLSVTLFFQGRYAEAAEYYEQAMKIWERKFRSSPSPIEYRNILSGEISNELRYSSKTDMNRQRLLEFPEEEMGQEQGKEVATTCTRLASSFIKEGKYTEAETLLWRAFEVSQRTLGKEDLVTVYALGNLARIYQAKKIYVFAEFLYEGALQLAGIKFNFIPAGTKQIQENYKQFLKESGREDDTAEALRRFDALKNMNS